MRTASSLCALLLVTAACAHARGGQPSRLESVQIGAAAFRLQYSPEDADTARQVKVALERAVPVAERWGRFLAPVLVTIHPTHRDLEVAAHREGYTWLRAWARYDSVDLQSPRTWSRGSASDSELAQLLAHELTHCLMYQSASSELTWRRRTFPVWFREGMASVTAGQEHPRLNTHAGLTALAAQDPLTAPEALYRSESTLVYATAHLAFRFLLDRYGEETIRRLIATMGEGREFSEAFRREVGVPVEDFEGEFRRQAVGQG